MPYKPANPCKHPGCVQTTHSGYCEAHAHFHNPPQNPERYKRQPDTRPSAASRGYGSDWQRIREDVLRKAGIPRELWSGYDVHHTPGYNPEIDPDHSHYLLTPLPHSEHSSETGRSRGRGGKSLQLSGGDRKGYQNFHSCKMEVR